MLAKSTASAVDEVKPHHGKGSSHTPASVTARPASSPFSTKYIFTSIVSSWQTGARLDRIAKQLKHRHAALSSCAPPLRYVWRPTSVEAQLEPAQGVDTCMYM